MCMTGWCRLCCGCDCMVVQRVSTRCSRVSFTTAHVRNALQGISIRFPRLVRVRDDKTPEQATTATQVMHTQQGTVILAHTGMPG